MLLLVIQLDFELSYDASYKRDNASIYGRGQPTDNARPSLAVYRAAGGSDVI